MQLDLLARLGEAAELGLEIAERGLAGALGDAATAVFLAGGAARSAWWAVRSNLREAGEHAKNTGAPRDGGGAAGAGGGKRAAGAAAAGGAGALRLRRR